MKLNELSWIEAIKQVLTDNSGAASLEKMYSDILKYRDVSTNNQWQATLRGILYRDMRQTDEIVRVGLGVFGLKNSAASQSTFQMVAKNRSVSTSSRHSTTQGMLIELGNFYGYDTYTADPNMYFDEKKLGSISSLSEVPSFTGFEDLLNQSKKIDVIWFSKRTQRSFPKKAFEVENTPEFKRSMLKLYQLRDLKTEFYLIADTEKESLFESRLNDDPFNNIRSEFNFRSFENVTRLYVAAAEHFLLKEKFFPN